MRARPSLARLFIFAVLSIVLVMPVAAAEKTRNHELKAVPPGGGSTIPSTEVAPYVADELLVAFDPSLSRAAREEVVRVTGARLTRELRTEGWALLTLPAASNVLAAADAWQNRPGVRFAEPNYVYQVAATPNDPRFAHLWGLNNGSDHDIDAPEAWDITTGSPKVVVAVVDTGVDWGHPDLAANIWRNAGETANGIDDDGNGLADDMRGWDFVANDANPTDQNGHGTHVAGIIGARGNNGVGITGVSWNVRIMPLRAGDANGSLTNADVIDSFTYACDEGARVVNGSFGGPGRSVGMQTAIDACPDALFVFAAGNEGNDNDTTPMYPCSFPSANIVCVAATAPDDALTGFSNFGAARVDLAAPGRSILSASHARFLFRDGLEAAFGAWTAAKVSGKSWTRTNEAAATGSQSATDSAGANYDNNSNTWIKTASPISLAGGSGCLLDYMLDLKTELDYDGVVVTGSTNGGNSWSYITGWSGDSGGFFHDQQSLSAYDGVSKLDLRFTFLSDSSITDDGVHVDDISVRCVTGTHGNNDYISFDGTSMAAPHVSGVAALVLAAHPNLTTDSVRQAVLDGVDVLPGLGGKVATGGRLNAFGALNAVDGVRPATGAPSQKLTANSTLTSTRVPVRVRWSAATDAPPSSGIFQYQLQQRKRAGDTWGQWSTVAETTTLAWTVNLVPGRYQFRVRAEDRAGNRSRWKAGASFVVNDPQGAPPISFSGSWVRQDHASYYEGWTLYTGVRGRGAALSFTARQVAVVSTSGPNRGRAKVYIDGVLATTVDLYRASTQNRRVVFLKTWASSGTHTIEVRVTTRNPSSSGSRVDLDAFVTLR